ncbi:hypothetical protein K7K06_11900 [Pseudomonas sp. 17]|uniref:Uncharacterized protein n=1 Tax=Pseudomonas fragariae (ex Marin et al. 2024) TaxID=3080056 RepID=A0ABT3LIS9_9PSED|nr:hypothetical protein [Pseudomonas fragi]
MNINYAEDWPFYPTEEQMLKQHAHLVAEENRLLRDEVDRYRKRHEAHRHAQRCGARA